MSVRFFIIVILALVSMLALFLVLVATDTALSVWQRLNDAPLWLQAGYVILLIGFSLAAVAVAWRWLRPKKKQRTRPRTREVSDESLQEGLLESAQEGVDVSAALQEIREQRRRKEAGEIHIAVFGEVSTGKSRLVPAMLAWLSMIVPSGSGFRTTALKVSTTVASGASEASAGVVAELQVMMRVAVLNCPP